MLVNMSVSMVLYRVVRVVLLKIILFISVRLIILGQVMQVVLVLLIIDQRHTASTMRSVD